MKKVISLLLVCTLCLTLALPVSAAETAYHEASDLAAAEYYADQLKALGLFRGSDTGYELSRSLSRIEALVMVVRLLGQENTAQQGNYANPFADMAGANWSWAWPYVGYAYQTGLTNGTGDGNFDPEVKATPQMYVTFVLRALGYGDADVESNNLYSEALSFGTGIEGLLTNSQDPYRLTLVEGSFWRADAVDLAFRALMLDNAMKDGGGLYDRLFGGGTGEETQPTGEDIQPAGEDIQPTGEDIQPAGENTTAETAIGIHHAEITVKDHGVIKVELDGNTAPITVANFMKLAKEGYYNGLTFHRMVDGFMIQGGQGAATETIKGEFAANGVENDISHVKGVISMARVSGQNDSASSQFFITIADVTFLDGDYAAFGHVTEGSEIAEELAKGINTDREPLPEDQLPVIESIVIVD